LILTKDARMEPKKTEERGDEREVVKR